jgi:hypothetical protein
MHVGVDAQTLEIRAIEVTDNAIDDAPMLPHLLAQIPEDELLHSVSADGAYDTRACHEAIAHRQATAIIPIRRNARPWAESRAGARARNEILRATWESGRSIWKKWSGYQPPSPFTCRCPVAFACPQRAPSTAGVNSAASCPTTDPR